MSIKDLIIVGAGPAGLTAGIYIARMGKTVALFERLAAGGQAALTHSVDNYPGFEDGINGMDLTDKMRKQVERFGGEFVYDSIEKVTYDEKSKTYELISGVGTIYQSKAVLISTGTVPRRLGAKGEDQFFGRGIGTCAVCDGAFYKNKFVAVIGGGNSALEESLFLTGIVSKVYIIHRRDQFRADQYVQDRIKENSKIELILDSVVEEFIGNKKLEKLLIKNVHSGETQFLAIDGVFLYVGLDPSTNFLDKKYKNERGFLIVDNHFRVNDHGLFAAGDCCDSSIQQIIVACGDGAKASYSIAEYLD